MHGYRNFIYLSINIFCLPALLFIGGGSRGCFRKVSSIIGHCQVQRIYIWSVILGLCVHYSIWVSLKHPPHTSYSLLCLKNGKVLSLSGTQNDALIKVLHTVYDVVTEITMCVRK